MNRRKRLDSNDIQHVLEIPSGSEDELELSDEDSDDDLIRIEDLVMNELEVHPEILQSDNLDETISIPSPCASISASLVSNVPSVASQPSTSYLSVNPRPSRSSSQAQPQSILPLMQPTPSPACPRRPKRRLIWKKSRFEPPISTFTGNENLEEPYVGFEYFV